MTAAVSIKDVLATRSSALQGLGEIDRVRASLSDASKVRAAMQRANVNFRDARRRAETPLLRLAGQVPLLGRQIAAVRALASSGEEATAQALSVYDEVVRPQPGEAAGGRVRKINGLRVKIDAAVEQLKGLSGGPSGLLLPPIAEAQDKFATARSDAVDSLSRTSVVLKGFEQLLEGPSRYLVLVTNNSAMRVGMGTALFIGDLEVREGEVHLTDLIKPNGTEPPAAFVDADLERNWGPLLANRDVRQTGITPRFDVGGAQAVEIWQGLSGQTYDGALAFDVEFIHTLLKSTGPMTVRDRTLDANNIVRFLTYDQYFGTDRQAFNAELGSAVFDKISTGLSSNDLGFAKSMADAVAARHLLLWSKHDEQQRAWTEAGAAGVLTPDSLMFGMVNRYDKLDPYIQVSAITRVEHRYRDRLDLVMTIRVKNTATGREPDEIAVPINKILGRSPAEYRPIVSISLPGAAKLIRVEGRSTYAALGPDGPTQVVAFTDFVQPMETNSYVLRFSLPGDAQTLRIEPSARMPAVKWTFEGRRLDDSKPHVLALQPEAD